MLMGILHEGRRNSPWKQNASPAAAQIRWVVACLHARDDGELRRPADHGRARADGEARAFARSTRSGARSRAHSRSRTSRARRSPACSSTASARGAGSSIAVRRLVGASQGSTRSRPTFAVLFLLTRLPRRRRVADVSIGGAVRRRRRARALALARRSRGSSPGARSARRSRVPPRSRCSSSHFGSFRVAFVGIALVGRALRAAFLWR